MFRLALVMNSIINLFYHVEFQISLVSDSISLVRLVIAFVSR